MKKFLVILLFLISILAFSGAFTETVNKVIDIAKTCQENLVFTEELYDLSTGEVWGIAAYIPLDSNVPIFASFINEEGVNGFLVIKFLDESTSIKAVNGAVQLTGKRKNYDEVKDVNPFISLITEHFYARVDYEYSGEFYVATDKIYIILYVSTSSLLNNYDYVATLKTNTAVGTWKIRKNGLEYQKFLDIIKEKQPE
jgi:hypothetical protein